MAREAEWSFFGSAMLNNARDAHAKFGIV